jgi:hypothetical protein
MDSICNTVFVFFSSSTLVLQLQMVDFSDLMIIFVKKYINSLFKKASGQ